MSVERGHPVLVHIEDAESWLARAKTSYRAANEIRGELDLSLAQAELRYAWEISRRRAERGSIASKPGERPAVARRWLPLVAVFTLFLALVLAARPWQRLPHRKTPLAVATPSTPSEEAVVGTGSGSPVASAPVASAPVLTVTKERPARRDVPVRTPSETIPAVSPQPATTSNGSVEEGRETKEGPSFSPADSPSVASPVEPAPAPAREEALPPTADLRPAAQLGFELGELERVAKETLISDDNSMHRNH